MRHNANQTTIWRIDWQHKITFCVSNRCQHNSNLYMCESTSFSHLHVAFHFQVNVIILKNWTWLSCTRHTFTNFDKKKVCCSSRDATIKLCQFVSMNSTQPKTKMWAEKTLSSVQLGAFFSYWVYCRFFAQFQ